MPQALLLIDVQNDDFPGGAYTLAVSKRCIRPRFEEPARIRAPGLKNRALR
jgi:nicotinamidase-related amidase